MYLLSAISSLYLFYNVPEFMKKPVYWDAVIYHLIFTFLLLAPVKKIDEIKSVSIPRIKNTNFFHLFTMVVIVLCLMSIKLAWQNIDFAAVFNEANSLRVFERESGTLEAYIRFFGTRYYSLALVLAFYYILHEPHKKTLIILLFVCSLSSVISGMQVAAREYLIKYIYLAGVLFLICKNGISKSWNRRIVIMGSIVAFLGIAMFMFISISRFGEDSALTMDDSTMDSLLRYYGMGFVNFSERFHAFFIPVKAVGSMMFPAFASETMSAFDQNDSINTNIELNSFSTTLGSWLIDGGGIFAAAVAIVFYLLFRLVIRMKMSFFKLYFIVMFCDYIFSYPFFFSDVINVTRIISILFVVIFYLYEANILKKQLILRNK